MSDRATAQEIAMTRVRAGAALLDEKGPDRWWEKINTEKLLVASPFLCPLYYVFGGYDKGMRYLGKGEPLQSAVEYGFEYNTQTEVTTIPLDAAWRILLAERTRAMGEGAMYGAIESDGC